MYQSVLHTPSNLNEIYKFIVIRFYVGWCQFYAI